MANQDYLAVLGRGVEAWNAWRETAPEVTEPDLSQESPHDNVCQVILRPTPSTPPPITLNGSTLRQNLAGINLVRANMCWTALYFANLKEANLAAANLVRVRFIGSDLSSANLRGANLANADLTSTKFINADLSGSILKGADLTDADLTGANLQHTDLRSAKLVRTNLSDADLSGARVYGIAAWGLKLEGAKQQNLVITSGEGEPEITVDSIDVARFIYLLLNNQKIRDVIDTIGKKGVLLLGRFTEGRMQILERLREKLRSLGFVPMVFNFDKPETKDFTETVRLLANLSRFVIVDITNPRSTPLELQATVPDCMIPFVPILQNGEEPFAMFKDLQNKYDWVLKPVIVYPSVERLIEVLEDKIVGPADVKFKQLVETRQNQMLVENV